MIEQHPSLPRASSVSKCPVNPGTKTSTTCSLWSRLRFQPRQVGLGCELVRRVGSAVRESSCKWWNRARVASARSPRSQNLWQRGWRSGLTLPARQGKRQPC